MVSFVVGKGVGYLELDWGELSDWQEYVKLVAGLTALINPLFVVSMYLGVVRDVPLKKRNAIVSVGVLAFVVLMSLFAFFGEAILQFFSISIHAFRVAGGILILLVGIEMMRGLPSLQSEGEGGHSLLLGIVPLGVPLLAGPSAVSTVIIYSHLHDSLSHSILMFFIVLTVGVICWAMLRGASAVERALGRTGMHIFNRVMGLIVASIGVEFILDGIAGHYPSTFG